MLYECSWEQGRYRSASIKEWFALSRLNITLGWGTLFLLLVSTGCSPQMSTDQPDRGQRPQVSQTPYEPSFPPYTENIPDTDENIEMIPVEGGTFLMGRAEDEPGFEEHEGPQRRVKVDDFWMAEVEITWDQYLLFVDEVVDDMDNVFGPELSERFAITPDVILTPSPPYEDPSHGMGRDGTPAVSITHFAALMYAKWLTAKTGHFYRLPTEAEWEYACRGGMNTMYYFGDDADNIEEYEWYQGNSDGSYNQVRTLNPNPYGLYDMQGNVAEWTMDRYLPDYHEQLEGEVVESPWFRPDDENENYPRSVRGGSWQDEAGEIRCTKRRGSRARWSRQDPQVPKSFWWHTNLPFVGFRIIRPKETPSREEIDRYWIRPVVEF